MSKFEQQLHNFFVLVHGCFIKQNCKIAIKYSPRITKYCLQYDYVDELKIAEFDEKILNLIREFDMKTLEDNSQRVRAEALPFLCINQSQPAISCSKLTIETLEQGGKYVQS